MQPDELGSDAGHLVVMWMTQPNDVWPLKDSTLSAVELVELRIQLDRRELGTGSTGRRRPEAGDIASLVGESCCRTRVST